MPLQNFGGAMMKIATKCIEWHGGNYVTQNKKVEWALEIFNLSTYINEQVLRLIKDT
jgi:hypothetical protein